MNWKVGSDVFTLLCVKQVSSGKLLYSMGSSVRCSAMTLEGWDGGWEGGLSGRGQCMHIADSLHCTAETSTIL